MTRPHDNGNDDLGSALAEELAGIRDTAQDLDKRLANGAPARSRARALGELEKVRTRLAKLAKSLPEAG